LGIGNWALGIGQLNSSSSPTSSSLIPHSPLPTPHSPLPNDILKTVVANYALDKLKIEIAGNSHPVLPSSTLWDRLGHKFSRFYPKQAVYVRIKSPP